MVLKIMNMIGDRVENGEKQGTLRCPNCGGNIEYVYENAMAMRAKCDTCDFSAFS